MFCAESYVQNLIEILLQKMGERLVYVGLQGSYLREEATDCSDIDIMVVIDEMSVGDLKAYKESIAQLGNSDKSCGFICGRAELANWNPLEICHVLHGTRDYYGKLSELVPAYTREDVRNFAKLSVNNLFHEICHRYLHSPQEVNGQRIVGSYKMVFFILQDIYYLDTGVFVSTRKELLLRLTGRDRQALETAMGLSEGKAYKFEELFSLLYTWCQETINRL